MRLEKGRTLNVVLSTFRVTPELYYSLDEVSKRLQVRQIDIIRMALAWYLNIINEETRRYILDEDNRNNPNPE